MEKYGYRFSVGPWNIEDGTDMFGPSVRPQRPLNEKLTVFSKLGFDAIQFHDDDAVPDLDDLTPEQISSAAQETKKMLDDNGLVAEFVAPRLWENPITVDGAYTSNNAEVRAYAIDRTKKTIDIALELGTEFMVIWLARDGTYLREAKDPVASTKRLIGALNELLGYAPNMRIAIEPKPNEPMDISYIPTIGHAIALGEATIEPDRMGVLVESAHAVLAGLDPSDEMAFALSLGKLFSVHLNDQNGPKYDQDRAFGMVNLRSAFNQVRVLDRNKFYEQGIVGVDIKALRTQPAGLEYKHLRNSLEIFLRMVEVSRGLNDEEMDALVANRDYEEMDRMIMNAIMGGKLIR